MHATILDYSITISNDFMTGTNRMSCPETYEVEPNSSPSDELAEERMLWKSVIIQAVLDATSDPINTLARIYKTRAIIWFAANNKDFMFVCDMAGVEPLATLRRTKEAIKFSTINYRRKLQAKRLRICRGQTKRSRKGIAKSCLEPLL